MQSQTVGSCALCQQRRELRDSHLVPKALYRLARAYRQKRPDPVVLTPALHRQTSLQATQYLLCADCEKRFDKNGEDWVMRHCYRGRDRFRLRDLLQGSIPIHADENDTIFNASTVSGIDVEKLVYFCVSIFWRASVRSWVSSGQKYEGISLGQSIKRKLGGFYSERLVSHGMQQSWYLCLA